MPRTAQARKIQENCRSITFYPATRPDSSLESVCLSYDELEAVKLADYQGLYQLAAARSMGVSRQTFGRIINAAHAKIADAILNAKTLSVQGGSIKLARRPQMIIVAPVKDLQLEDHFGQCSNLTLYKIQNQSIDSQQSFAVPDSIGCRSGLAAGLAAQGVTHLVTGRLGAGVRAAFEGHGIKVFAGHSGDPQVAIQQLLAGQLADSATNCNHDHSEGHSCCNA